MHFQEGQNFYSVCKIYVKFIHMSTVKDRDNYVDPYMFLLGCGLVGILMYPYLLLTQIWQTIINISKFGKGFTLPHFYT